jgi:hypothetical protein
MTLLEQLEHLIDQNSLQCVLNTLADVCNEKAEHLQSNWQDTFTANLWTSRANAISKVADRPLMSDR